jgi:hypothetical protein
VRLSRKEEDEKFHDSLNEEWEQLKNALDATVLISGMPNEKAFKYIRFIDKTGRESLGLQLSSTLPATSIEIKIIQVQFWAEVVNLLQWESS